MIVKLSTKYSRIELDFLKKHNCRILSEIKLSKSFEEKLPVRMFTYGRTYIGEIKDEDGLVWAVLSKFKGKYHWGECYDDLEALEDGF